jgi:hypothetical protein
MLGRPVVAVNIQIETLNMKTLIVEAVVRKDTGGDRQFFPSKTVLQREMQCFLTQLRKLYDQIFMRKCSPHSLKRTPQQNTRNQDAVHEIPLQMKKNNKKEHYDTKSFYII